MVARLSPANCLLRVIHCRGEINKPLSSHISTPQPFSLLSPLHTTHSARSFLLPTTTFQFQSLSIYLHLHVRFKHSSLTSNSSKRFSSSIGKKQQGTGRRKEKLPTFPSRGAIVTRVSPSSSSSRQTFPSTSITQPTEQSFSNVNIASLVHFSAHFTIQESGFQVSRLPHPPRHNPLSKRSKLTSFSAR